MTDKELIALLKKHPLPVACVGLAVALAVASYFRADDLPTAAEELEKKSAEAQRIAANIQNAAQLNEQLGAIVTAGKEIEGRLIRVGELAKNLQYFYKLESETGTKLTELRQLPPANVKNAPKTAFTAVGFSVGVQGDYTSLVDFLRRLEHGTHYCRVVTSNIAGAGVERGLLRLSITVELLGQP